MFDVYIDKKNHQIHTRIVIDESEVLPDDLECAFYLYKDNTRIEVIWYTKKINAIFEIENANGVYYVKGFVRSKKNKTPVIRESRKIMYNKSPYDIHKWKKNIYDIPFRDIDNI